MLQNVVPTIFHTQNIYNNVWKIVRTTLQCIVGLQLQGEGHEMEKTVGQICPIVFLAFQTFSLGLENNKTSKCGFESFPGMATSIMGVENCQSYILKHSCLPIAGTQDLRVQPISEEFI